MNIFFLALSVAESVHLYCDQHVVKIILEVTQMLSTVHHLAGSTGPYRPTHGNHPMTRWVGTSQANYRYTLSLLRALLTEYTCRYQKIHRCQSFLPQLEIDPPSYLSPSSKAYFATSSNPPECTPVPECMPERYHHPDLVQAYKEYYLCEKLSFARWRSLDRPPFEPPTHILEERYLGGHLVLVGRTIVSDRERSTYPYESLTSEGWSRVYIVKKILFDVLPGSVLISRLPLPFSGIEKKV